MNTVSGCDPTLGLTLLLRRSFSELSDDGGLISHSPSSRPSFQPFIPTEGPFESTHRFNALLRGQPTLVSSTMRFFAATKCLIIISCVATLTTGSPLQQHEVEDLGSADKSPLRQRQTSGTYAITGIQSGGIHPRLNIRDMMNNTDMFNLYLLGLRRFMDTPESDPLSYHSICCKRCCRPHFERLPTDLSQQYMAVHTSPSMESLVLRSSDIVRTCPTSSHNGIARTCCSSSKCCTSILSLS